MNETKEKSSLPEGWRVVRLGDYAKTEKGKKPKIVSAEKTIQCPIPYINIKAFERNIIDEYTDGKGCVICEDDDFLMVWDGSRSGYVGKAITGALGSTLVKIKLPDVNHDFAYYFLQSKYVEINTRAKGVGIPHVDPNIVWNYQFPLPPKSAQQAIVSKIEELFSELDKGIETLRLAQQQLKTYRQAVLKCAFEGNLTEEWRKENGTSVRVPARSQKVQAFPTEIELKSIAAEPLTGYSVANSNDELPEGWSWSNLSKISKVSGGLTKNAKRQSLEVQLPFLRVANVYFNSLDLNEIHTIGINQSEIERVQLEKGDLLFVEGNGSIDQIGRVAIWDGSIKNCVHQNHLIKARFTKKVLPKYALYFFLSKAGRGNIKEQANSTSGLHTLSLGKISQLKLPLSEIEEQQQIVSEIESRLSVADKMQESIAQSLQQSEALRQSILKKAFEGKLC